jgi:type VI secretion system FHA domain protein
MQSSSARKLVLRVTRHNGQPAGADLHKVFCERGGTIGRAAHNDWCLPDAMRVLSAHHATVFFEQGRFHLVDCSSNGVFVNDEDEALGIERIATLNNGDRLLLGNYEMTAARIDSAPGAAAPEAAVAPETSWSDLGPRGLSTVDGALTDDVVDPLELLVPSASQRPASRAPATERNDAPMLSSAFLPPAQRAAVPEDWLEPAFAPSRPAQPAPDVAQILETASAALRDALAAIETLKAGLRDADPKETPGHPKFPCSPSGGRTPQGGLGDPVTTEAGHGLE